LFPPCPPHCLDLLNYLSDISKPRASHAMFCKTPTIDSVLAAFIVANRRQPLSRPRRPELQSISSVISLNLSRRGVYPVGDTALPPPPSSSDTDWFADGRESARRLKIELGIANEFDDAGSDEGTKTKEGDLEFELNDAVMESGRAAARELLKEIGTHDDESNAEGIESDGTTAPPPKSPDDTESQPKSGSHFNFPSRKSHCITICLVPPPSATKVWDQLTAVRRECMDPGFYRWPPHANILYPFLEPVYDDSENKDDQRINFRNEIAMHLSKAAMQCEPFDVTINSFGTFGGKQRGVLWAYPMSKYTQPRDNDDEPLINLHRLFEQQFPICNEQIKSGAFHPHMTLSHYATNANALAAKEKIEYGWEPVSFRAHEVYLLERKGDNGQFKISATISLGADSEVEFHDPPIPFPTMPAVEEEWVHDERMEMKNRRKKGDKRRRSGGRGKEPDTLKNGKES